MEIFFSNPDSCKIAKGHNVHERDDLNLFDTDENMAGWEELCWFDRSRYAAAKQMHDW